MSESGRNTSAGPVIALLIGVAAGFAFLSAGVPGPQDELVTQTLASSSGGPPAVYASFMTSNNARTGAPFRVDIHAPEGCGSWLLASLLPGQVNLAGQLLDLGPDWFVLRDVVWTGASGVSSYAITIPNDPSLGGFQFRLQAGVYDPAIDLLVFSNGAPHEVIAASPFDLHICLIRQSVPTTDMLNPTQAPDALAAGLRNLGLSVDVFDDAIPAREVLARYDVLFDCRFVLPPSEQEKEVVMEFLRDYGGVFLLHGPFSWSPWSSARKYWIDDLIMNRLGIGTQVLGGGNAGGAGAQQVAAGADPAYLTFPSSVAGTAYDVQQEGGNFGLIGQQGAGTPWITDSQGPWAFVYGMLFRPSDMSARTLRGSLAVLFTGNPAAFTTSAANPTPEMIMYNLAFWLDI